ncbi:UNVERIFIED_CONTAM: Lipid phosphate phosphatase gamma [Sesamum angustifolium]|uniref:Lipid phosphate phosphatase gamma n=1 Tax=Sesamum angustifolium TaxID=2727405 RepID=A0AAW2N664_9LAMI
MTNSHPPLKAVTLTHVRYRKGDQFGHLLAWISLIPVFISLAGFVSHFIFRRELQGMFFALGILISEFVNQIIKKSVQQARPRPARFLKLSRFPRLALQSFPIHVLFRRLFHALNLLQNRCYVPEANVDCGACCVALVGFDYVFEGLLGVPYCGAGVCRSGAGWWVVLGSK